MFDHPEMVAVVADTSRTAAHVSVQAYEERELQARTDGQRLFQLDALRGLAAVTVVCHHARWAVTDARTPWYLAPLFCGESAVVLFFVLSGYVLSLPYWESRALPYVKYAVRRVFRIYVPFLGALAVSLLCAVYFQGRSLPLTPWFLNTWHTPVTLHLVLQQLTIPQNAAANTALWSLRYEMEMSLLMPLVCAALHRFNALLVTSALCAVVYAQHAPANELSFGALFVLGAAMARYRHPVGRLVQRAGVWSWLLLGVSLILYWQLSVRPDQSTHALLRRIMTTRTLLLSGLGSCGIIAFALHLEPFARVLRSAVTEYLGRISFSLYMFHGTAMFAALYLFYGKLPTWTVFGIGAVLSLVAAHVFCVLCEEPITKWGRALTR